MNHLFVPEKESLELKTLGFDEPCLGLYPLAPKELIYKILPNQFEAKEYFGGILAPLYSQIFDWFREKHGYIHTICRVYNWNKEIPEYEGFCIYIGCKDPKIKLKCNDHFISNFYQDYREAELIVLKTLIEIVKNDNL